jgi:ORF6N domain
MATRLTHPKTAPSAGVSSHLSAERIQSAILIIRGRRVLLDVELAGLYGVDTNALVRAVKRNLDRFRTTNLKNICPPPDTP